MMSLVRFAVSGMNALDFRRFAMLSGIPNQLFLESAAANMSFVHGLHHNPLVREAHNYSHSSSD